MDEVMPKDEVMPYDAVMALTSLRADWLMLAVSSEASAADWSPLS